jgi:WD40 repeat protein
VFSPDSSLLATWHPGKETRIRLWDVRSGRQVRSFQDTKPGWPGHLFFTADARTLLVVGKYVVGLDVASGKELFSWRMEPLKSNSGVSVVDSEPLKSNSGASVVVGGQPLNQADRIAWRTLAFSPEGTLVAFILSGEAFSRERMEDRIALYESRTGRIIRRWNDSGTPSLSYEQLSFSRDARFLASSDGPMIRLWEVATGKEIRTFQGHRGEIRSLVFSTNGQRLASASTDRTVLVWDLPSR